MVIEQDTQHSVSLRELLIASGTILLDVSPEEQRRVVEVLNAFDSGFSCTLETAEVVRIISGHINTTYCLMHTETAQKFIIQQLNTVFNIDAIDNNLQWLETAQELSTPLLPAHWQTVGYLNVKGRENKIFYDAGGNGWRVMRFVPGDIKIFNSFSEVPEEMRAQVARSLGEAIAVFGKMLDAVPADVWHASLPNFHNARYHLQYLDAVQRGERVTLSLCRDAARQVQAKPQFLERYAERTAALLAKIDARKELVTCLDDLGHAVAHGDTKINNFVFRRQPTGELKCVCLIDLDTVQPGNMLDDLGDALRSAGNPAGEEPKNFDDVRIDEAIVSQIIGGYLAKVREYYSSERERQLGASAVKAFQQFLYVQSARFFADALIGNEYFKLKPGLPEDINLYRGEVQMRALEALEDVSERINGALCD